MTRALPGATRCPRGPGRPRTALAQLLMEARRGSSCYSLGTVPEGAGRPPSWRCPLSPGSGEAEPPSPPRWGRPPLPPVSWPRPSQQALGSALDPPLLDHRAASSFPWLQPYPQWAGQGHKDGVSIQLGFPLTRWVDSLLQPQCTPRKREWGNRAKRCVCALLPTWPGRVGVSPLHPGAVTGRNEINALMLFSLTLMLLN